MSSPALTTFGVAVQVHLGHVLGKQLGAESLGLLAELVHQVWPDDAIRKAGKVLDVRGVHQGAAGRHRALKDQRAEPRPGRVQRCRIASRPGADDDDVPNVGHFCLPLSSAPASTTSRAWRFPGRGCLNVSYLQSDRAPGYLPSRAGRAHGPHVGRPARGRRSNDNYRGLVRQSGVFYQLHGLAGRERADAAGELKAAQDVLLGESREPKLLVADWVPRARTARPECTPSVWAAVRAATA